MIRPFLLFVFLILLVGCTPYQSLVNFNPDDSAPMSTHVISNYKPIKVEPSDILRIELSSIDAQAVQQFNEFQTSGYLIDSDGNIEFPLVGKIQLAGMTIEEAKKEVLNKVTQYFKVPPTINLYLSNFSVTINGEVSSPGKFTIPNDRLSIIEAVTMAGDFTPYSKRDSVMVIRESEGKRSFGYVNFNNSTLFESPYYFLRQNDVVYVKPEKRILGTIRSQQDKYIPYISVGVSIILLALSISRSR